MIKAKPRTLCTSYAIEIGDEKEEKISWWNQVPKEGQHLYNKVDALDGVYDCDYCCQTGPHVYYSIVKEHDTPSTHAKILQIVNDYIDSILTEEEMDQIDKDFREWSGGFESWEAEDQIDRYIEASLDPNLASRKESVRMFMFAGI